MTRGLGTHRGEINENAPKITTIAIPKDKIREVIGSGGKVIREIIEKTGAKIEIDDDGNVTVAGSNGASVEEALDIIRGIALDPIYGTVYNGKVMKIMDFGAFINFVGTKEGLVHISEMSDKRVEKVTDIMNEGDVVKVKFLGYDSKGRAKLTMKFTQECSS
jgi:polyribonucleotide nucleotidyltransferase